jgi:hypothetical protein
MEKVEINNELSKADGPSDQLSCIIGHNQIDGIIVNPNCKLCNSVHRREAEKLAEESRSNINFAAIKAFLETKGESIALANVKNHILRHFLGQSEKIALEEYRQNLVALSKARADRCESIKQLVDIAMLEMSRVLVMQVNGVAEEKDRQRMIHDNMKIIMDCQVTLEGMEDGDKKVRVVHERVRQAFAEAFSKVESDPAKRALLQEIIINFNKAHGAIDRPGE